jgi:hypothetical protein
MVAREHHLNWLRENIVQHLSRVDRVLAELVPGAYGVPGVRGVEPWLERLLDRRQSVQSKLFEVEQQIERRGLELSSRAERLASGDDR